MERHLFEERLKNLATLSGWDIEVLRAHWVAINQLPPRERSAMDPRKIAPKLGLSVEDSLAFFLMGSKAQIFQQKWSVFNPQSGWVLAAFNTLSELSSEPFFDPFFEQNVEADLQNSIAVTFTVMPQFFDDREDPYDGPYDVYQTAFFAPHIRQTPDFIDFETARRQSFHIFTPHEFGKIPLTVKAGEVYRIVNRETGKAFVLSVDGQDSGSHLSFYEKMLQFKETKQQATSEVQLIDLELKKEGFTLETSRVQPGRVVIWVQNQMPVKAGFVVHRIETQALAKMRRLNPVLAEEFLSGKDLLNIKLYRTLFLDAPLPEGFALNITGLTVLFANFKSATTIQDQLGDRPAHAYLKAKLSGLVQHIEYHGGFLVKTISDEVMATFPTPLNAVKAAWDMVQELWEVPEGHERLELKVGINSGSALLVEENNNLDFFGRVVNVAAKLQTLSESKEIWLSMSAFSAPGVVDFLHKIGADCVQNLVTVKGDDQKSIAYACKLPLKDPVEETEREHETEAVALPL